MPDRPVPVTSADVALGEQIIDRLRRRQLPQMVDWFDPMLLAKIGVRTIVSATMGQYADQRLMQAATDRVTEEELARRYDYSDEYAEAAQKGLWVDYISDLGDGFEATYAMAYLMAPESLTVKGVNKADEHRLPAGEILVMGGDQAYPQSSVQEYQDRFLDPYNWAYTTDTPRRKLFALPGNHDWYDGLGAFDSLFCSARDRISGGIGKQIGGWRCHQHRSYFAIKLPHDWWIWGADIQLAGVLDDSQRDYFDLVSKKATVGHTRSSSALPSPAGCMRITTICTRSACWPARTGPQCARSWPGIGTTTAALLRQRPKMLPPSSTCSSSHAVGAAHLPMRRMRSKPS